jgi:hypothetical protein
MNISPIQEGLLFKKVPVLFKKVPMLDRRSDPAPEDLPLQAEITDPPIIRNRWPLSRLDLLLRALALHRNRLPGLALARSGSANDRGTTIYPLDHRFERSRTRRSRPGHPGCRHW